jgi:hypothetical protein
VPGSLERVRLKKKGRAISPGQIFTRPPLGCAFWATTGAGFWANVWRITSLFVRLLMKKTMAPPQHLLTDRGRIQSFPRAIIATANNRAQAT